MDDHDGRARLVILLLADPHLLKVDMEGKMEPPILARYSHSGGAMTLHDLHCGKGQGRDLLLQSIS